MSQTCTMRAAVGRFFAACAVLAVVSQLACTTRRWPPGPEHPWKTVDPLVKTVNEGVAAMEAYDYKKAAAIFEKALAMEPGSLEVQLDLAVAVFNRNGKGDLARSTEIVEGVLESDPANARALYLRGIIYSLSGEDEKAVGCFQQVVEKQPHDAYAWYLLGRSKGNSGGDGKAELERALQENPNLISAYFKLIPIALRSGDREKAAVLRKRFAALYESPVADTVVSPQYRRMGPLACVEPVAARPARPLGGGDMALGGTRQLLAGSADSPIAGPGAGELATAAGGHLSRTGPSIALADVNGDGLTDLISNVVVRDGRRGVVLLLGTEDGGAREFTDASGLAAIENVAACAFGDHDNDGNVDLFLSCAGPNHLLRGRGDGTFEDVTKAAGAAGPDAVSVSAVFLDADHDGDLDIYVCNFCSTGGEGPAANQLLNNNADGTFTDIAAGKPIACAGERSVHVVPLRADADRDTDLLVLNEEAPARLFLNDRAGNYHAGQLLDAPLEAEAGAVSQDFNGDGLADVVVFPGPSGPGALYVRSAANRLQRSTQFDGVLQSLRTWEEHCRMRVLDIDRDGDLDIAAFGEAGHVLLNDGWGRFVLKADFWPSALLDLAWGVELADRDGDGLPELILAGGAGAGAVRAVDLSLEPRPNWVAITPTGDRGVDNRTRSSASGFGTRIELRAGLHRQFLRYTGLSGGTGQSASPAVLGLDGAPAADYLLLEWPDGVTQSETGLAAGARHRIQEVERRMSSCPVLFAFDGKHFAFVCDFAGVGGLGYLTAPGTYAPPEPLDHVRIAPGRLAADGGAYRLRITEPMEEVAYVDRLELLAVDHPAAVAVYPDERLAAGGSEPTHRLLVAGRPIFPQVAVGPRGEDCTERLRDVDRVYAYQPDLDRRFTGFCRRHSLVLDFGDRLGPVAREDKLYLFVNGAIEYPYSQTTYAASQAGVAWEPLRVERQEAGGGWEVVVADAGAPGGIGRTFTVDLTGKLPPGPVKLRLTTNREIYIDQVFAAQDTGTACVKIRKVPLRDATLRRLGFPLEYSPDGHPPTVYTYDTINATSTFSTPEGAYTRYGPVEDLLRAFDDRYVILASGDEIALRFDARAVPAPAGGSVRTFILVSHAYCKDMDLYTAEPESVKPLPFRAMSGYPYREGERYPQGDTFERYRREYNTRRR